MILHDLKLIFIHLPRTGGSITSHSLAGTDKKIIKDLIKRKNPKNPKKCQVDLLNGEKNPHYPFSFWEKKYPKKSQTYLKIGTIRNPFDWLPSLYHHFPQRISFDEFVTIIAKDKTLRQAHADYNELSCFFSEALKNFHYVIKFENLKENLESFYINNCTFDEKEIVQRLEILELFLPGWATKNRKHDYQEYYSLGLKKFVEEHWAKDLKKYNYSFDIESKCFACPTKKGIINENKVQKKKIQQLKEDVQQLKEDVQQLKENAQYLEKIQQLEKIMNKKT